MKVDINIDDLGKLEYQLLISMLGVLTALSKELMTIDDAERVLFQPVTAQVAESLGLDARISHLLWLGTELEDIESLLPHRLQDNISEMLNEIYFLLSETLKPDMPISSLEISYKEKKFTVFRDYTQDDIKYMGEGY